MKALLLLTLSNFLLLYRVKVPFFFTFVLPLLLSFAYFGVFARGNPLEVAQMMGPLISLTMTTNALLVAGMRCAEMRGRNMFRQYYLTPVRAIEIVLSDMIVGFLSFLPVVLIQLAIGSYIFHAPFRGSYLWICVVCSIGYFPLSALGLLFSNIFNTVQEAQVVTQVLFLVLIFFSGTTMPLGDLPRALQNVAIFTPPALIIIAVEGIILRGDDLIRILPEMITLLLSGITAVIVTSIIFRWDKEERVSRRNRLQALLAVVPLLIGGVLLNFGPLAGQWLQDLKTVSVPISGPR